MYGTMMTRADSRMLSLVDSLFLRNSPCLKMRADATATPVPMRNDPMKITKNDAKARPTPRPLTGTVLNVSSAR